MLVAAELGAMAPSRAQPMNSQQTGPHRRALILRRPGAFSFWTVRGSLDRARICGPRMEPARGRA
eukprot:5898486-Prymnesium_polylepis.1